MTMRLRKPKKLGDTLESWLRQDGRTSECVASTWRYLDLGLELREERVLGGAEGSSCSCLCCCSWSCCCVCLSVVLVDLRFLVDAVATPVVAASDMAFETRFFGGGTEG